MTTRCLGAPGALLAIISGPSGVGKDTILRELKRLHPDPRRHFVVTYKSRPKRPGEVDGLDYHFVSRADFGRLRESGMLLEAALVHGHWSGTPRDQVINALQSGRDAILKIDVQGAQQIRAHASRTLLIFVAPPSFEELSGRLHGRATESEAEIERRQQDASHELAHQQEYDYVVVNETGQAERTAERIDAILAQEHVLHPDRRVEL